LGSKTGGTYTDTQTVNDAYEAFRESSSPLQVTVCPNAAGLYTEWPKEYPSGSAHWSLVDEDPPDDDVSYVWNNVELWKRDIYNLQDPAGSGTINWVRVYVRARLSSAGTGNIRTLVRTYDTDYESSSIALSASYQNVYTQFDTNPKTGLAWTWSEINSLQAGASSQKVGAGDWFPRMTAVWVVVNYSSSGTYRLDINGTFTLDVSTYPLAYVQTLEIRLRYRANDTAEKWYIKAYNWTAMTYSDSGFNNTAGHTPTTGWDYYALNLTDKWNSYVSNAGTIYVKLQDNQPDSNQTTVDIDFLGVRAKIDGARFTLRNEGSLTTHLVSLWIINSTLHQHYDANVVLNSAETYSYIRADIKLPSGAFTVKVVSERGNTAVYSSGS